MVKNKLMNGIKMLLFLFVLTICIIVFGPLLMTNIHAGIFMFFEEGFWSLFFFITGVWFIFGLIMWLRGYGKKGDEYA